MTDVSPPDERALSPEEAFQEYLEALSHLDHGQAQKLHSLYRRLAAEVDLMRLLHMLQLGVSGSTLRGLAQQPVYLEARARGWIEGAGPRLTLDGLTAWMEWVQEITPHRRLTPFQELWRVASGW